MANILDKVKTVVLLMFENRSFDHILGHFAYENINSNLDGLKEPLTAYNNVYKGDTYNAFAFQNDVQLPSDPPHEYIDVATQLAKSDVTGKFTMNGFVQSYAEKTNEVPNTEALPMGFFTSRQVPVSSFLAHNFCTCDRWFTSIPTSTQPNRNMAFFGDSASYLTTGGLINMNNSILDWMNKARIRWRVYHDGLSFFALYPKQWKYVLGRNFKRYEDLAADILHEPEETAPQVIIVEPTYGDAPHIGSDRPNDNHPPLAMGWGEEFLRNTYRALIANPRKWEGTVFIVYYDEHGGFYDHVPPPGIPYQTKGTPPYTFESLGPRIPAIIASPFVKPASVSHSIFDHTSVLNFLAEKFSPGHPITETVKNRHTQGIASITEALTNEDTWSPPQPPSTPIEVHTVLGRTIETAPTSDVSRSFETAANQLIQQKPAETKKKYPELFLWKEAVSATRKG